MSFEALWWKIFYIQFLPFFKPTVESSFRSESFPLTWKSKMLISFVDFSQTKLTAGIFRTKTKPLLFYHPVTFSLVSSFLFSFFFFRKTIVLQTPLSQIIRKWKYIKKGEQSNIKLEIKKERRTKSLLISAAGETTVVMVTEKNEM